MGLFRQVSTREVLRCLADGLRLVAPGVPVRISGKSSISRARSRLGTAPFEELRRARVAPLAGLGEPGRLALLMETGTRSAFAWWAGPLSMPK